MRDFARWSVVTGALLAMYANAWAAAPATRPVQRTKAEVEALIDREGRTPPPWWNSVQLDYPKTLDLTWKPTKEWNNQRNVGQYIWDIIDPNPGKWKEGVKLVHHVLAINKDNPDGIQKSIEALSRLYFELLQDYPRAAFWGRKYGRDPVRLAVCYWKMGNKQMAVAEITGMQDYTRNGEIIKLWASMGELQKALDLVQGVVDYGRPDVAYLAAGDAYRLFGRYDDAIKCYEKVLPLTRGGPDFKLSLERARASIQAIKVFDALDLSRIPDGAYRASSVAFTGPLEVEVTIKAGRISGVRVTKHTEKQFYSSITDTTGQIIAKQGVKGIDATSGATITSEAIINASAKALASGMK